MVYRNCAGIFHELCKDAAKAEDARFVLLIDEINRGKASRIFGEPLYLLEYRDQKVHLASGEEFKVPKNVYLIGTMNTADRSIALVDTRSVGVSSSSASDPTSMGMHLF